MSLTLLRRSVLRPLPRVFTRRITTSDVPAPPLISPAPAADSKSAYHGLLGFLKTKHDPTGASELDLQALANPLNGITAPEEEYQLSIYATKHNTHITFCDPQGKALISVSAGNLGFKKGNRGSYDAAYQLAAHVFRYLEDEKRCRPKGIEVVLRGFGQGRDAVTKALLGQEGRFLKNGVTRVTDSTRLKFGGTRSPRPRRLG